ncbi:hypothetical protein CL649_02845 [bacterium]|nr:hypothetical protein [bacterium]|tara:strand:- start:7832 stop:8878 length:1047 start_codon:yes stop_codon:yes gene_type:complete
MSLDIPEILELPNSTEDELRNLFHEKGWGDGLPMIAPTRHRVEEMLRACESHDPDEVIAILPPRSGIATRRIIAINAVMAGCKPEHLPVLVSAIRALNAPEINLRGINATTHCVAPLLIVHGKAVKDGNYNSGLGAFGPGNPANATTGRAIRLMLHHIAGAIPGVGDASTQGSPAKYSYCVAENLDSSPWGGYARSEGIDAESAVTIHCGEAPHNVHDMESSEPSLILDKVASAMTSWGQNNAPISQGEYFLALCPEHAATCAQNGWGRHDIASYVFNKATVNVGEARGAFELRAWAPWQNALKDTDTMSMTEKPENIKIFVTGGAGKHSSVIPSWGMTKSVTIPVTP